MPIIRISRRWHWLPQGPSGSRVAAGWKLSAGRLSEYPVRRLYQSCYSLRSGHSSNLPELNFQPAATREPDDLCGNQRYRRDFLMMGIMMPETC